MKADSTGEERLNHNDNDEGKGLPIFAYLLIGLLAVDLAYVAKSPGYFKGCVQ